MNVELAKELRMELDYGFVYMKGAFTEDKSNRLVAMEKILEARIALGAFAINAGMEDPYPSISNTRNNVVEPQTDTADRSFVIINIEFSEGQHLKYLIKGLKEIFNKVIGIRMSSLGIQDPKKSFLALKSLDRCIDSIEHAIGFLGGDLQRLALENPEMYPSFDNSTPEEKKEVVEEVETTNSIMESRASESLIEKETPLTGADFLPGGRAYKESKVVEKLEDKEETTEQQ